MSAATDEPTRPVPATVGILTYNSSIATVEATIRSALDFSDILLCDGGSTDGTRELARSLGCRIIDQAPEFIDASGRLLNEAGVNSQILDAALHDWVFFLDHDELATPELVAEMAQVLAGDPVHAAFEIPRLFVLDGTVIQRASIYPSYMPRLVHRGRITGFGGLIHSPVVFDAGATVGRLKSHMLIPLIPFLELWRKWLGYMRLEEIEKAGLTGGQWRMDVVAPNWRMAKWLTWRTYRARRDGSGSCLPWRYEIGRIAYRFGIIFCTGRRFIGLGRTNPEEVWDRSKSSGVTT